MGSSVVDGGGLLEVCGSLGGSESTSGLPPCGGTSVGAGGEGSLVWG